MIVPRDMLAANRRRLDRHSHAVGYTISALRNGRSLHLVQRDLFRRQYELHPGGHVVEALVAAAVLRDPNVARVDHGVWRWSDIAGPPIYVLRLQPLPNVDDVRALRAVLKSLLRNHGLRCLSCVPETTIGGDNL